MTTLSQSLRIAAAAALFSLAACSSKNPDSLVGMNLDENAAMMDSNEAVDANAVTATVAETNAGSQPDTSSQRSGIDTRASGVGRIEYAEAPVRSFAVWL